MKAQIGVRFTGPDQLVHLIGLGEVVPRLGRGVAVRLHRPIQAAEDFTDGNQPVSLTRHGVHSLMPVRQKRAAGCAAEGRWCMNRNWPATNPTHRSITYQERTTMAYRARPSG